MVALMPEMISEYQMSLDFDQDDDFAELDALDEDFCEVEPQVDPDDTASHKRARVIPIRGNGQFDLRSTDDRTPCQSDPDAWFPDLHADRTDGESDPDPEQLSLERRRIQRTAALCDTCFFRVNCAINALEAGDENGIFAGVLLDHTPARLKKAQARLAEVVAADIIDNERVPQRLADILEDRADIAKVITEAAERIRMDRIRVQSRRAARRTRRTRSA
ncbi:hypothetical protein B7435_07245 [Mycolicibacterium peregrinum]|uniref:4Fe-4S Wbl-type domain-containing protein n=3 Tax=Mycobacteriaceae TaxID=1762 RepID=A0A6N4V084_9MYCO|nr:hypothetical protein A5768_11115 [Mycolicibacterium fortuitum]OWM07716.1 hypothetical protein B7435_07245 [Mycolicibacterium peregrinum]BBX30696.1 hypothetical protein MALV_58210 [Mycolicibacterium alvei]